MIIGVPKEIKRDEYRVALLPVGVEELVRGRAQGAGRGRGRAGFGLGRPRLPASRGPSWWSGPEEIFARADMIIKVKEPQPAELPLIRDRPDRSSPTSTSPPAAS